MMTPKGFNTKDIPSHLSDLCVPLKHVHVEPVKTQWLVLKPFHVYQ